MRVFDRHPAPPAGLPFVFDPFEEMTRRAMPSWARPTAIGYLLVLAFFGGVGGIAALIPLHSAVMANGEMRVENGRQVVEHPIGGIVTEIDVREGQTVREGDLLLRLDPIVDQAQSGMLHKSYLSALAERARLMAERDDRDTVTFPREVTDELSNAAVREIVEDQKAVLKSRRDQRDGQVKQIRNQIDQAHVQIAALQLQKASVVEQLRLIEKELASVQQLYDRGLERRANVLELKRSKASLTGQIGNLDGSIAQSQMEIGDLELRATQVEREMQGEVATQLGTTLEQIQTLAEQQPVAADTVRRLDLRAPSSGKVIDLHVHTVGQVVAAREDLMQIVPDNEDLVVDAEIKQHDIVSVNKGVEKVEVMIMAQNEKAMRPIEGRVESVASDVTASQDGYPFYRAIVRVDKAAEEELLKAGILTSGMPAMVMLEVGDRSLLNYLFEPLWRSVDESLNRR